MHFLAPDISQEYSVVVVIAPFYRQHTEIQRGQRLIRRHKQNMPGAGIRTGGPRPPFSGRPLLEDTVQRRKGAGRGSLAPTQPCVPPSL